MNKFSVLSMLLSVSLLHGSCVLPKKFNALKDKERLSEENNAQLRSENQSLAAKNAGMESDIAQMKRTIETLETDTTQAGMDYRRLLDANNDLNKSYQQLSYTNEKMLSGNAAENKKIIAQLNATQEELLLKGDSLKKLGRDLALKEKNLEELNTQLQREDKIKGLQNVLNKKDSIVTALKNSVANALTGFNESGLTVYQKNGKVYVSLEERLLFPSGSWTVEPKGQEALKQLSKVLEKNPDINVQVEGHTDDVPMKGNGEVKDNWDLSVMRGTSVVKILTASANIDPKRLTAAGRGQNVPLDSDNTPEARKKNRRTEIILPEARRALKGLRNELIR